MKNEKNYIGTFAHDNLPKLTKKQKEKKNITFIVNYHDQHQPGSHWICIYGKEFFDSFGIIPSKNIQDWLRKTYRLKKNDITYSINKLQHTKSNLCGYFCIEYIKKRNQGLSQIDILHQHFDPINTEYNEKLLHNKYK